MKGESKLMIQRKESKYKEFVPSVLKKEIAIGLTMGILNFFEKENSPGLFFSHMGKFNNILRSHDFSKELYMNKPQRALLLKDKCCRTTHLPGLREGCRHSAS